MTVKETAEAFNLKESIIRKLCKENKIKGVKRQGRRYLIPDGMRVIITDENVQAFLYQLLKVKNNSQLILSEEGMDTVEKKKAWHEYLIEQGLVERCEYNDDFRKLLMNMRLTDKGLGIAIGNANRKRILNLSINPAINVGLVVISNSV